jgi:hypothetical protein
MNGLDHMERALRRDAMLTPIIVFNFSIMMFTAFYLLIGLFIGRLSDWTFATSGGIVAVCNLVLILVMRHPRGGTQ